MVVWVLCMPDLYVPLQPKLSNIPAFDLQALRVTLSGAAAIAQRPALR